MLFNLFRRSCVLFGVEMVICLIVVIVNYCCCIFVLL